MFHSKFMFYLEEAKNCIICLALNVLILVSIAYTVSFLNCNGLFLYNKWSLHNLLGWFVIYICCNCNNNQLYVIIHCLFIKTFVIVYPPVCLPTDLC